MHFLIAKYFKLNIYHWNAEKVKSFHKIAFISHDMKCEKNEMD